MAITMKLGGIRLDENRISTVMPLQMLLEHSISGMAFEPKEKVGEDYDHLDERVRTAPGARKHPAGLLRPSHEGCQGHRPTDRRKEDRTRGDGMEPNRQVPERNR